MWLHLKPDSVYKDKIADSVPKSTRFTRMDLYSGGAVSIPFHHSWHSKTGVFGQPSLASAEKGQVIFEEAVRELLDFSTYFKGMEFPEREDHHEELPSIRLPG
jgi:creatinine amidohydrolase/Fe(II)-dependent formamide hydrolase-like protein